MELVPYIRIPLMHQKIATQSEALEIVMKLEASFVGETGVGMNRIQLYLANMMIQLQEIKKGRQYHEEIWCTRCHAEGQHKDHCLNFQNYLLSRAPNSLSHGGIPWCHIFQVHGHRHEGCVFR